MKKAERQRIDAFELWYWGVPLEGTRRVGGLLAQQDKETYNSWGPEDTPGATDRDRAEQRLARSRFTGSRGTQRSYWRETLHLLLSAGSQA